MTAAAQLPARREVTAAELARLGAAARSLFAGDSDVLAVYLYGSAARGEPAADLDVALLCEGRDPDPATLERYAAHLQTHGAPGGPDIDLRALGRATPRFRANVLRDAVVLFDRDTRARTRREARFMIEWLDFRPTWERMRRRMLERWARG